MLTTEQARKLQKKLDYYVPEEGIQKGTFLKSKMHELVSDYIYLKKFYEEINSMKLDGIIKHNRDLSSKPIEETNEGFTHNDWTNPPNYSPDS